MAKDDRNSIDVCDNDVTVIQTSDQRSFTKGRITGSKFFTGQYNVIPTSGGALQSAAAVALSCRYWGLNDPFCRSRLLVLFNGWTTPKIVIFRWTSRLPSNTGFVVSRRVNPQRHLDRLSCFLRSSPVCPTHADKSGQKNTITVLY